MKENLSLDMEGLKNHLSMLHQTKENLNYGSRN